MREREGAVQAGEEDQRRNARHADRELDRGVRAKRTPHARFESHGEQIAQGDAGHERRQHESAGPCAAAQRERGRIGTTGSRRSARTRRTATRWRSS